MKIIWHENPLATVVYIDDGDRKTLRAAIKADGPYVKGLDRLAEMLETKLAGSHAGDCTCLPCSCPKCYAEILLGVDTIAGLDKHEGSAIASAFYSGLSDGRVPTITEALDSLRNYKPTKGPSWERFSDAEFQKYVPRWAEDAKRAAEWLEAYQQRHQGEFKLAPPA